MAQVRSSHGQTRTDHYAWLRAPDWQACLNDPEKLPDDIKNYLQAENDWFEHVMSDTQELQGVLLREMQARIQGTDCSLPDVEGDWSYIERYNEGDEYASYWRYPRDLVEQAEIDARTSLLIDFNQEAAGHDHFDPGDVQTSPAQTHMAWSSDMAGNERYQVAIRRLSSMEDEDFIEDVESLCWGDAEHLFYTRLDDSHRANRVYRHRLGTDSAQDILVYEESDPRFFCSIWKSLSGEYVFISSDADDQNEVWFIPTHAMESRPSLVEARTAKLEYSVEHQGDYFLILTNADDATDFKLVTAPCENPSRAYWKDWLVHRQGVMVLDVFAYADWVMWLERENALPGICYCRATNGKRLGDIHRIAFEQRAYALGLEPLLEFNECVFRFDYESPSEPAQTYAFDMQTGRRRLLKQQQIPSGHDPHDYCVHRIEALSTDGARVPITLLHHRNTDINGTAPCWLTAYGAYGASMPATFDSERLSLVDRGFVFAIAHVRGGQEKGRLWYEAARFDGKHRSFDDVIAAGHCLVEKGYTAAGNVVLAGASAGGLLVGAVLNRESDLWGAAIAAVPFVDALNTLCDDGLPLTPAEWSQWGNPRDDVEAFKNIRSFCPYQNVAARRYPPLLVTAGVSDPRVTYWEPAKWVAKHRYLRCDDQVLLLKTDFKSGHFGETGRYASLSEEVTQQAFALKVLGLT